MSNATVNKIGLVRASAIILGSGLLLAVVLVLHGVVLRREMRAILNDIGDLTSASNRKVAFRELQSKYSHRLQQLENCVAEDCAYELKVANHVYSALRLVPYTEFSARFDVRSDEPILVYMMYRVARSDVSSPVVHVQIDFCTERCGRLFVHPWETNSIEGWNGIVQIGFAASDKLRQSALALNVNCLTTRRCIDVADLLPTVWQRTPTGTRCLIPNHTGNAIEGRWP